MNTVEIRPLPKGKLWHGKTEKEFGENSLTIEATYDSRTGQYATGLTEEEREKYEKELNVDLSPVFDPENPHPYYSTANAKLKLKGHTTILYIDRPQEYIKYKLAKASKYIANSIKEWEEGKWPEARYYIFDEVEEVKVKASKIQKRNEAIRLAAELTNDEKVNLIQIISNISVRGAKTDKLDVELDYIIENKTQEFLNYVKMDKQEAYARATIMEAISRNVLIREGATITYMGEPIASDLESAVEWFINPQNQKLKVALLDKLSN